MIERRPRRCVAASLALVALPWLAGCGSIPFLNGDRPQEARRSRHVMAQRVEITPAEDRATAARLRAFDTIAVKQKTPTWCWAACAEMIARFNGIQDVSQEAIAARIHGLGEDGTAKVATASRHEIYRALCPDAPATPFEAVWSGLADRAAETAAAMVVDGDLTAEVNEDQVAEAVLDHFLPEKSVPIDQLLEGHPAVVGLRDPGADQGHVYVLIGATYREPSFVERAGMDWLNEQTNGLSSNLAKRLDFGDHKVVEVELIDPWFADDPATEANEMRTRLSIDDFADRLVFITTEADARAVLESWGNMVEVAAR